MPVCSIFPRYAGGQINPDTEYNCLGDLLGKEGYKSYFLFSQQRARTMLDELLLQTNIDQVLAQEELQQMYLHGAPAERPMALSDQQFLEATIAHLRTL